MTMRLNTPIKFFWMSPRWTSWLMSLLLAIALLVVTNEVLDLKHQINLANHDAEVNRIRAALIEKWVDQQVQSANGKSADLAGANPMRLMLKVPLRYLGEYESPPVEFRDIWFFDTQKKCLVYIFENGDFAAYRLAGVKRIASLKTGAISDWRLERESHYKANLADVND